MAINKPATSQSTYRTWHSTSVPVAGVAYAVFTKPGVFGHGRTDPAALMLAERAIVAAGDVVLQLNCGGGLFSAVAAASAERVVLTDRNVLSVEAARRTMTANNIGNAEVVLGHGTSTLAATHTADVVAIRIPEHRLAVLQLLRNALSALRLGGRCYIAGANNEGIKTAARTMEQLFGNATVLDNHSGSRIVAATKRTESVPEGAELHSQYIDPDTFNELTATLHGHALQLFSRPGVFSWDHVDEATQVLADCMRVNAGDSVLDLGCGSGGLGAVAALLSSTGAVCMLDADVEAVRSAMRTVTAAGITNARVLPSDVCSAVADEQFDVVVANPPFHVGKATDLSVPFQFIHESWDALAPGGTLFLVANRTLPYERAVVQRFGNIETVHDGRRFKVLAATRSR